MTFVANHKEANISLKNVSFPKIIKIGLAKKDQHIPFILILLKKGKNMQFK